MSVLTVNHLKKTYTSRFGIQQVRALRDLSFSVEKGEYVAVMGESGSGKTTLLNILAALDTPSGGSVQLDGRDISTMSDKELSAFRRDKLGFVFQEFNLLDTFSLKDNILLPIVLAGRNVNEVAGDLSRIAKELGISDILGKMPCEVSGGQKQRAAVARALITSPKLILADEPTGALDSGSASELLRVFTRINESGQTILMVTHSVDAASHAGRVLFIRDGIIFHELYRGEGGSEQLYKRISDTLTMLRSGGEDHE